MRRRRIHYYYGNRIPDPQLIHFGDFNGLPDGPITNWGTAYVWQASVILWDAPQVSDDFESYPEGSDPELNNSFIEVFPE